MCGDASRRSVSFNNGSALYICWDGRDRSFRSADLLSGLSTRVSASGTAISLKDVGTGSEFAAVRLVFVPSGANSVACPHIFHSIWTEEYGDRPRNRSRSSYLKNAAAIPGSVPTFFIHFGRHESRPGRRSTRGGVRLRISKTARPQVSSDDK